jgi:putative sigma-54 modulation protein
MELKITGKNVSLTHQVDNHIKRRYNKLVRHLSDIHQIKAEITEENTKSRQHRYIAQITIDSGGVILRPVERAPDILRAIDRTTEIMDRQTKRFKGKRRDRIRINFKDSEKNRVPDGNSQPERELVNVKQFAIKPMPIDEAIEQIELLGHDFFLFLDTQNEEPRLLYRRHNSDYGLIEPESG